MKKLPLYALSVSFISIFTAFLAQNSIKPQNVNQNEDISVKTEENSAENIENNTKNENSAENSSEISDFLVLDKESDCVMRVSAKDYVIGAVAAEMPAEFEEEALKAQAVAAYTYAVRQKKISSEKNDPELHGADFSDDPEVYQAFYSNDELKKIFGNNYDKYYNKINSAVEDVFGYCIYYENEPVIAAFHSISSGKTESAEDVWGTDVPYLVSVDSESDKNAEGYNSEVVLSADEVFNKLLNICGKDKIDKFKNAPEKLFGNIKRNDSGYISHILIDDKELSGEQLRDIFGLRSADFEVVFNNDKNEFTFNVKGYGHGVGMSQYGAEKMAESGADWKEILTHYYPNTSIMRNEE